MTDRPSRLFMALLACIAVAGQAGAAGPAPVATSIVVDSCRTNQTATITSEEVLFDLSASACQMQEQTWVSTTDQEVYRGVAWATMPGYDQNHVFMSRGRYIDVLDLEDHGTGHQGAYATFNVAGLAGIPGLEIGRIAAGSYRPFEIEPGVLVGTAALYLTGFDGTDAYYIVLDQEWLITGSGPSGTPIYGSGVLCPWASCGTSAVVDLAVGDLASATFSEEAYFTVIQDFGLDLATTYRVERDLTGGSFTATGVFAYPWDAPEVPESSGLAFAEGSHDAYAVRKPGFVRHLASGEESCELAGEPTDVLVWEPEIASVVPRYLLVTTSDGPDGRVEFVPAASCANGGATAFTLDTFAEPTAIDIYPVGNNRIRVLVTAQGQGLNEGRYQAFLVKINVSQGVDTFTLLNSWDHDMIFTGDPEAFVTSCPTEVVAATRYGKECGVPKGPERNCLPDDPRCPG